MPYIGTSPSQGVRRVHTYTATASQTTFTGAGAEGATLSYKDSNFVDVYQNGVKLGDADYTATSGTSIVLGTGATASDLIVIVAYDVFSAADTVSKADGGQFDGNVTMAGTLGVTGDLSIASKLVHIGDTDTHLQFGDNTIELFAGNVNILQGVSNEVVINQGGADVNFRVEGDNQANLLVVDAGNDRIGIGTSSPSTLLMVEPSARTTNFSASDFTTYADILVKNPTDDSTCATGIAFITDATTYTNGASGIACISGSGDTESSLAFITRPLNAVAAERMRIDSSGNVGIGTTSPAELLEVHGNTPQIKLRDTSAYSAGTGPLISFQGNDSGGAIRHFADIQGLSLTSNNGVLVFSTRSGGTVAERVRITDVGRVGIGETSPDTPLHVTYTKDVAYSIDNFTQDANCGLKLENTSSTGNAFSSMQFRIGSGADLFFGAEQKSGNDGDFVFGNQNSTDIEMARITNRPCLVVGSSSDTDARIYGTRGDAGSSGFFESTSSATSGVRAISTSLNQNSNNTNCQHLRSTTQNVATFTLNGNGSSTFSSDERLKKNIETTRDGYLEDLSKLRVVKYNWHCDDDSTDKELGLIAQEVQQVFPKLVKEDDVELNGIEKPLALKVSVLPMMLLKALQEANTKITTLEARIEALENA